MALAAAAIAAGLLLAAFYPSFSLWLRADYRSDVALIRPLTLPDGSQVTLGADSAIALHFSPDRRDVELLQGEAYFAVATDKARPFDVVADELSVTVTAPVSPNAPPARPNLPAGNVISLFSNAYTNVTVDKWSADWDAADVADVFVEQRVDLAAILRRRLAQRDQCPDLVECHVQVAALPDEGEPLGVRTAWMERFGYAPDSAATRNTGLTWSKRANSLPRSCLSSAG